MEGQVRGGESQSLPGVSRQPGGQNHVRSSRSDRATSSLTFCPLWCPQAFLKGVPPRQKLLPTGGAVLTTEDTYMAMVDRCFPDDSGERPGDDITPFICSFVSQEVHLNVETGHVGVAVL